MLMSALSRKFRTTLQRALLLAVLAGVFIFALSYVNLDFCFKVMSQRTLTHICDKYRIAEYSGSLCEELCGDTATFKSFKCPAHDMKNIVFTAEKNGDVYAIKRAKNIKDDLGWINSEGRTIYPKIEDFHHIIKMHIMLSYNVTLDDNMIKALVNQEIDKDNPEQMLSFWRLFKDNNYMIGKLFDEETIFPSILGSCGPYYATETLTKLQTESSFMEYFNIEWERRLRLAAKIMEFIIRMNAVKPEPLKICKFDIAQLGLTSDKRLKYETAEWVQVESQVDKRVASGAPCVQDSDCDWHQCRGSCDKQKRICNGTQQNNNLHIFCEHIITSKALFPEMPTKGSMDPLNTVVQSCLNPTINNYNEPGRVLAPNNMVASRLMQEILGYLHSSNMLAALRKF